MRVLFFLCRLVFGGLFVYAGAEKMMDAAAFAGIIYNYHLLPAKLVYGAAMILPAVEVICGLALCVNWLSRGASGILTALMIVFMGALGYAMARGLDVTCGCFGGAGQAVTGQTMLRDAGILVVGLIAMWGAFAKTGKQERKFLSS